VNISTVPTYLSYRLIHVFPASYERDKILLGLGLKFPLSGIDMSNFQNDRRYKYPQAT
jgi:hypothetical protein